MTSRPSALDRYLMAVYALDAEGEVPRPARLAAYLGVRAASVSRALSRLEGRGWVQGRRPIRLTPAGRRRARRLLACHQVAERWLVDMLHLEWATVHADAERLAAVLTPALAARLWRRVGRPRTCPHGNPIPDPGTGPRPGLPLARAAPGAYRLLRVTEELEGDEGAMRALAALGLAPGAAVEVDGRARGGTRVRGPGGEGVLAAAWLEGVRVWPAAPA